jgi:hypothetical protein
MDSDSITKLVRRLNVKFLGTFLGDAFQRKLVLLFDEILLCYGANFLLKNCWWLD